jgi:hypothetical protein
VLLSISGGGLEGLSVAEIKTAEDGNEDKCQAFLKLCH